MPKLLEKDIEAAKMTTLLAAFALFAKEVSINILIKLRRFSIVSGEKALLKLN